jgi:hypothetical protein
VINPELADRDARLFCCTACATAIDVARDGAHSYPVRCATAADGKGLYWALTGQVSITVFAATEPAKTPIGTVEKAGQRLPFAFEIPAGPGPVTDSYQGALARVGQHFETVPWTALAKPPEGTIGRREAERLARQVFITLATRAEGNIHKLELTLDVEECAIVRVS